MLLSGLDLLQYDPFAWFIHLLSAVSGLVIGITIHEGSHAASAFLLGDNTAKRHGRLTLNPLRHLDPIGSIMILLVGFGWGKPTPVNEFNLSGGRRSSSVVALAGPCSNLLLAFLLGLPIRLAIISNPSMSFDFVVWIIWINVALGIFNMLPIPPLDGFRFVLGIAPTSTLPALAKVDRYGPIALLGLFGLNFIGIPIFSSLLYPPLFFFVRMIGLE